MKNLISIIIPVYNIEKYIGRCLESVCLQSYDNIEIIVVNDGSTDDSKKVINQYALKDSRIKPIHKENGGVTSARLRGVTEAIGEWIAFVDGDDYIEKNMFEQLLNNALEYEADISHCGYQMVFPNGKIDYYYNTECLKVLDNTAGLGELLKGTMIEPGLWNKLFRKELFDSILDGKLVDASIKINEDLLMNYYLFKQAKVSVYEDVCPYHYILRKNSAATSSVNVHKLEDPIKVTRVILGDMDTNDELRGILLNRLARQLINNATMQTRPDKSLISPLRKKARYELKDCLIEVLTNKYCPLKLKVMTLWANICPTSYRWVHVIYEKITGLDKKYSLE